MVVSTPTMEKNKSVISILELKRLLFTIQDHNMPIFLRYRLIGEMWQSNFMKVSEVTENGAILIDESGNKLIVITDLSHIIQFELDGRIHAFEPNYHYDLSLQETE